MAGPDTAAPTWPAASGSPPLHPHGTTPPLPRRSHAEHRVDGPPSSLPRISGNTAPGTSGGGIAELRRAAPPSPRSPPASSPAITGGDVVLRTARPTASSAAATTSSAPGTATADFTPAARRHPSTRADPLLAPLADYGGPHATMALRPGSPARERRHRQHPPPPTSAASPSSACPTSAPMKPARSTNYNAFIWETLPATATAPQHATDLRLRRRRRDQRRRIPRRHRSRRPRERLPHHRFSQTGSDSDRHLPDRHRPHLQPRRHGIAQPRSTGRRSPGQLPRHRQPAHHHARLHGLPELLRPPPRRAVARGKISSHVETCAANSGERARPECWFRRPAETNFPAASIREDALRISSDASESPRRRDAFASTRDERAPRNSRPRHFPTCRPRPFSAKRNA